MNSYFDNEIKRTELELTRLKTSRQKSAAVIQTVTKKVSVDVPLSLNSTQTVAQGYKTYRIIADSEAIFTATLDWYSEDIMQEYKIPRVVRSVDCSMGYDDTSKIVRVTANGTQFGNPSDVSRLVNGESVSIQAELTIQGTDNFTVEVY